MSSNIALAQLPLMLTSDIYVVPYQNQENNKGRILLTKLQTLGEFQHFCH